MKYLILIILAVTLGACQSVPFPKDPSDSNVSTGSPTSPTESEGGSQTPSSTTLEVSHIPQFGEKSEAVKTYQKALNKAMGTSITEDGDFGPVTRDLGAKFQKSKNLEGTGQPGPVTMELLGIIVKPSTSPSVPAGDRAAVLSKLTGIASASSCSKYAWKNRGNTPIGYDKGMAILYAKSYCNQFLGDVAYTSQPASTRTGDVLRHYAARIRETGLDKAPPLRQTWTILMGLGPMESSGQYCAGADYSTTQFKNANAAESGGWQTSWDVSSAHPELKKLFARYKANPSRCYLDVFKEGVSTSYCASTKNKFSYGKPTDEGYQFQELQKKCPALAAEYAAVTIRVAGGAMGHYGPLRCDREVNPSSSQTRCRQTEVRPECSAMFAQVESYIDQNPLSCNAL